MSAKENNQSESVKVAVRLRPFTEREKQKNTRRIVDIEQNTVALYNPKYLNRTQDKSSVKTFTFDYSYWSHDGFKRDEQTGVNVPDLTHPNCDKYVGQNKVFDDLGKFLLDNALEGYNSALLAYGQTGSGKSYTVLGYGRNEGILPRFARSLFDRLDERVAAGSPQRFEIYFSMIEIYNEVVRDLLAKDPAETISQTLTRRGGLKVREHPRHGFFVENLTSLVCANKTELERRIDEGQLNKSIAATSMNETSSRGHTIYEFRIKQYTRKDTSEPESLISSVVQLVDLAGSERMVVHIAGEAGGGTYLSSRQGGSKMAAGSSGGGGGGGGGSATQQNATEATRRTETATSILSMATVTSSSSQLQQQQQQQLHAHHPHHQRFKESVHINQSLSTLGNCIQIMSQYSQLDPSAQAKRPVPKIPYRDSNLTKLLNRCCLNGNSKVAIIATLSPADLNYDDTLSTLRFADRAKQIQTHAIINIMNQRPTTIALSDLQRENERLKRIVSEADGRVTRSDDSSQTELESSDNNHMEAGRSAAGRAKVSAATQADTRRQNSQQRGARHTSRSPARRKTPNSETPPAPAAGVTALLNKRMQGLVSPASKKLQRQVVDKQRTPTPQRRMYKSKSMAASLSPDPLLADELDLYELRLRSGGDEVDDDHDDDEDDQIIYSDDKEDNLAEQRLDDSGSDEDNKCNGDLDANTNSSGGGGGGDTDNLERLSNDEKIEVFNKLLSNSMLDPNGIESKRAHADANETATARQATRTNRPRAASKVRRVSDLSAALKRSNPYLSNLNPDEQMTNRINYIIKHGTTVLGRDDDCDIVLRGAQVRSKHARIHRESDALIKGGSHVYIEPIVSTSDGSAQDTAIMVNGSTVIDRTDLSHCDRVLFGTNLYFVFVDSAHMQSQASVGDVQRVSYDMARNEVLKNVIDKSSTEDPTIKEIHSYRHRPGTGKMRRAHADAAASTHKPENDAVVSTSDENSEQNIQATSDVSNEPMVRDDGEDSGTSGNTTLDELYQEKMMNELMECTMALREINNITKEMGINVTYSARCLLGEEQIPEQMSSRFIMDFNNNNNNTSDGFSSSSHGYTSDATEKSVRMHRLRQQTVHPRGLKDSLIDKQRRKSCDERVTILHRLENLDIAPAVYVRVHLADSGMDFYWSQEKFQARRMRICEIFGFFGFKKLPGVIEHLLLQFKSVGDNLSDPFIDNPQSTYVLVGRVFAQLKPLASMQKFEQELKIVDIDHTTVGYLSVMATPCKQNASAASDSGSDHTDESTEPYVAYSDAEIAQMSSSSSKELIGKPFIIKLHIKSCRQLSKRFRNVFCQYVLKSNEPAIRTRVVRNIDEDDDDDDATASNSVSSSATGTQSKPTRLEQHSGGGGGGADEEADLQFEHVHYIAFERVTEDVIDFLEFGFLNIQMLGQYRLDSKAAKKAPTFVTFLIEDIKNNRDKYSTRQSSGSQAGPFSGYTRGSGEAQSSLSSAVLRSTTSRHLEEIDSLLYGKRKEDRADRIITHSRLERVQHQLVS